MVIPLDSKYSEITDDDLDAVLMEIKNQFPYDGESFISGHLRARGIQVQRWRMRESIYRVNPVNAALRWHQIIPRGIYKVLFHLK